MIITTAVGYTFETEDDSIEVGTQTNVPIPQISEPTYASDKVIKFLAQMYGLQKEWNASSMGKFSVPDGLKHFPDYVLTLHEDGLKDFLIKMYAAGASLVNHKSGSGRASMPEVRFRCEHESLARELQFLWLRVGIKTRIYFHTQLKKWVVQSAGNAAYVEMRPYLIATRNPKILKKMKDLDRLVPFKFRVDDYPVKDRVVEISSNSEPSDILVSLSREGI